MGIGFLQHPKSLRYWNVVKYDPRHRWITGNHDDPGLSHKHRYCLSPWGYDPKMDLFWISGGYSIDRAYRTIDIDWWEDEEISYEELQKAVDIFHQAKPRYVASHECPATAQFGMFPDTTKRLINNRTKLAMEEMLMGHQPEIWVFGHYHLAKRKQIGQTYFVCCGDVISGRNLADQIELTTFEIPMMQWD